MAVVIIIRMDDIHQSVANAQGFMQLFILDKLK